jgi:hypothetical protein
MSEIKSTIFWDIMKAIGMSHLLPESLHNMMGDLGSLGAHAGP